MDSLDKEKFMNDGSGKEIRKCKKSKHPAFEEWLNRLNPKDKLPRGKYFKGLRKIIKIREIISADKELEKLFDSKMNSVNGVHRG